MVKSTGETFPTAEAKEMKIRGTGFYELISAFILPASLLLPQTVGDLNKQTEEAP